MGARLGMTYRRRPFTVLTTRRRGVNELSARGRELSTSQLRGDIPTNTAAPPRPT
jgi:hypothetical protein